MHGCKICASDRLIRAHSLSCGHRFCQDCLLALLPNTSNPISVLPQHTAIIVCPRCHERCEYSQVVEMDGRKYDKSTAATGGKRAPSYVHHIDDGERQRQTKRAQFVQAYMKQNGHLSRKSRSRFEDGEDDNTMLPEHHSVSLLRGTEWRTRSVTGAPAPKDRGDREEVVDIRAIDHVNGRFVTCKIIQSSCQDTNQDDCATSDINQQPQFSKPSVNRNVFQSSIHNNSTGSDNFEPRKERKFSVFTEDQKAGCLFATTKQRAFLVLLIILFIVIVATASLISSPYTKFG